MKGFVIAGTGSGSGKTTLSLGVMAYLLKLGYKVAPFKVGPDFIDPGHHRAVTGKVSRNLDSWMLARKVNEQIFAKGSIGADVAVVEGVMGLFDGYSGTSEAGSTAQMAKWLGLPVVLVVDARSMARSAAALVKGFENFDSEINFVGVLFNKTGSQRHYDYIKEAIEANCRMKCLGHLPRNPEITMPERHLGLVTSDEHTLSSNMIERLVEMLEKHTLMREMVENLPPYTLPNNKMIQELPNNSKLSMLSNNSNFSFLSNNKKMPQITRIAVARDKAFCFYYQENFEALQRYGAELVEFSPITSPGLPPNIDGIYLGGGYPELFAKELSNNRNLMNEIREKSLQGMPIYGECGGFMYLCKDITVIEGDNQKYTMTGCFPFSAVMSKKMRALGYREVTLKQDTIIGKKGDILRGHEFHYSSIEDELNKDELNKDKLHQDKLYQIYDTTSRDGKDISLNGYQIHNTLGSYLHIHFDSIKTN